MPGCRDSDAAAEVLGSETMGNELYEFWQVEYRVVHVEVGCVYLVLDVCRGEESNNEWRRRKERFYL